MERLQAPTECVLCGAARPSVLCGAAPGLVLRCAHWVCAECLNAGRAFFASVGIARAAAAELACPVCSDAADLWATPAPVPAVPMLLPQPPLTPTFTSPPTSSAATALRGRVLVGRAACARAGACAAALQAQQQAAQARVRAAFVALRRALAAREDALVGALDAAYGAAGAAAAAAARTAQAATADAERVVLECDSYCGHAPAAAATGACCRAAAALDAAAAAVDGLDGAAAGAVAAVLPSADDVELLVQLVASFGDRDGAFARCAQCVRAGLLLSPMSRPQQPQQHQQQQQEMAAAGEEHGNAAVATATTAAVIDATLAKPVIRSVCSASGCGSEGEAAVVVAWTTPRDFEQLHRPEGFWYELEVCAGPGPGPGPGPWRRAYRGVERAFVLERLRAGTACAVRCRVCVAGTRHSLWSPVVAFVAGTALAPPTQPFPIVNTVVSAAMLAPPADATLQPHPQQPQQQSQQQQQQQQQRRPVAHVTAFVPGPRYGLPTATTATARGDHAAVLGAPLDRTRTTVMRVRLVRGAAMFVGVAPSTLDAAAPGTPTQCGWYLHVPTLTLHSGRPHHHHGTPATGTGATPQPALDPHTPVALTFNARTHTLRFSVAPDGAYLPGRYTRLTLPPTLQFLPVVILLHQDDAVELLPPPSI